MRLFKIYHKKYTGEIEVLFSTQMLRIDFSNTNINANDLAAFKRVVPATLEEFLKGTWCGADAKIIEADYEASFVDFWAAYNKKINKIRAEKNFNSLSKLEKILALQGIKKYDAYLTKDARWRTKADPETYLRNKMWENEYN